MQQSLDKQREAVRRQSAGWLTLGESNPGDGFLLPWPKASMAATDISLRVLVDDQPPTCLPLAAAELDRLVEDTAARQKVDPKIVKAVIQQESAGRPCVVSSAGAEGIMQLMPATQREYGVQNPFDARESIEGGVKLLRQLIDRYAGDLPKALAAYNAGPAAVDRIGGIPPIPETQNYVSNIVRKIQ